MMLLKKAALVLELVVNSGCNSHRYTWSAHHMLLWLGKKQTSYSKHIMYFTLVCFWIILCGYTTQKSMSWCDCQMHPCNYERGNCVDKWREMHQYPSIVWTHPMNRNHPQLAGRIFSIEKTLSSTELFGHFVCGPVSVRHFKLLVGRCFSQS